MNNFILELEKLNLEKIEKDISLSTLTTYKTGGIAKLVVYPNNINNLKQMLKLIHKYNIKYLLSDFKKEDGYKRSIELSKKYNLYRQDYCGCLFSKERNVDV